MVIICHPIQFEATSSKSKNRIFGCCNATLLCVGYLWWWYRYSYITGIKPHVFRGMDVVFRIYIWEDCSFRSSRTFGIWCEGQTSCEECCRPKNWNGKKVTQKMAVIYVTIAENEQLRNSDWNEKYNGKRVVLWDNNGLSFHKPTDDLLQPLTYSPYYAEYVAKGGIYLQLCGWLGVHELYPGAMSADSDYLNKADILQQQLWFQEGDGGMKFLHIVDRGYRSTRAAWASGQLILQLTFAKSDKQFSIVLSRY